MDQSAIDALRDAPVVKGQLFIDGSLKDAADGGVIETVSPLNGSVLTTLAAAGSADVDRAVAAARAAYDDGRWSGLAPGTRGRILQAIGDKVAAEALNLAVLGVRDNGT